jgi:hypothetical protein
MTSGSAAATGRNVDQAALVGTALAAVLALTLGEGAWNWLALAAGCALFAVLLAYFHPPTSAPLPPKSWLSYLRLTECYGAPFSAPAV